MLQFKLHQGQKELQRLVRLPDSRVVVAVLGRRWGKTSGSVEVLLRLAKDHPGMRVGWWAHQYAGVRVAWEEVTKRCIGPVVKKRRGDIYLLELVNGWRLEMFSGETADAPLGRGFDLVVIDEGARVPMQVRDEIIWPMLADRDGKLLVLSTPKGKHGRGAWLYRDYKKAQLKVPGYYCMTGPSTDNPLPAMQKAVQFAQANLPAAVFSQEYLAEFLESGNAVLDLVPVCTMGGSPEQPVPLPYEYQLEEGDKPQTVMGLDLAQKTDWMVGTVLDQETGECLAMDRYQLLPWETQVERAASLAARFGANVFVDATGLGGPVVEMLQGRGVSVVPVTFTQDRKQEMVQGLQLAIEKGEIALPYIAEAVAEAECFEAEVLSSGRVRYGSADGFHDDIVTSLGLAVWGRQRCRAPFLVT